ncbi:MAG: methylmalonyl-CoA mutase [Planctomycetes bacterium]|nr:methylmalonyl-CoA mutase [Planctomycetota bacterium]
MSRATQAKTETEAPIRFVTAASLFDGHDASINVMRRILQAAGCEVVHLGHNRAVHEIVQAAIQEDVQGIAVSSYQGGHMEFFKYMKDLLIERGAGDIKIFGGGGGTIVPREIAELQAYGIDRIYSPEDGRRLGLEGMINEMVEACAFDPAQRLAPDTTMPGRDVDAGTDARGGVRIARLISYAEGNGVRPPEEVERILGPLRDAAAKTTVPVIGITGPGGAGKSSFTDELLLRWLRDFPNRRVAVFAVDPSKRKTGGALLGDRIRMNAVYSPRVFMRSLATRGAASEVSEALREAIDVAKGSGFDLIIVETSGIGQGSSAVVDVSDVSIYVMTPEYGAASQLEKIDMIDLADLVVVNKFERRGAEDALRDVRKQYRRVHGLFHEPADDELPVFGTIAARFADPGVTSAYLNLLDLVAEKTKISWPSRLDPPEGLADRNPLIPGHRTHYLAEVAQSVRGYRRWAEEQIGLAKELDALEIARDRVSEATRPAIDDALSEVRGAIDPRAMKLVDSWPDLRRRYESEEFVFSVRGREIHQPLTVTSLAGNAIRRVATPRTDDRGVVLRYLLLENVPGGFPFTGGVFALKRDDEDPKRMFAGEGGPDRTNRRFHYLSRGEPAKRLSTAFDSVTLYGCDPAERPDIYGKVGESGVSICMLDDMKALFAGFDLCDRNTSVSMTINGPAPIILAMFLNAAVDQQVDAFEAEHGRIPDPAEHEAIAANAFKVVRGTVQADILKEDQAQNTCIFSTEFALRMMGDMQSFFVDHDVRNYYSVSISGYHIAEAGANPISQLAFTLANGFTYVEYYLARGMKIDDFARNLSFFFSNGLDPEYAVLGRVARRIWAIAVRDLYEGNERSQKLKYHVQTSGRSLHAQEVDFNDIRTTLQALLALQDHCNSLHTNAYDEAVTTPTEGSVRRAMAIQLIINREYGIAKVENALQGSYIIDELTDLVEEAVLTEFDRISERGGVLGAMETQYQRGKIQEESLHYERLKHSGELPVIGVNTFVDESADHVGAMDALELTRASDEEKRSRLADLHRFQGRHASDTSEALQRLQDVAFSGGNVFAELMRTVRVASLGQITDALFAVGGEYRRNL